MGTDMHVCFSSFPVLIVYPCPANIETPKGTASFSKSKLSIHLHIEGVPYMYKFNMCIWGAPALLLNSNFCPALFRGRAKKSCSDGFWIQVMKMEFPYCCFLNFHTAAVLELPLPQSSSFSLLVSLVNWCAGQAIHWTNPREVCHFPTCHSDKVPQ